jgi:predicted molibdopterin-dependent oxidoreductase YjgC
MDTYLPDDCGYNKIFKYQWTTNTHAIPLSSVNHIRDLIKGRFGWHFVPHKNMDYSTENWYENQTLVITFENKLDLILSKLTTTL